MKTHAPTAELSLTMVICTRNRPDSLLRCVRSVLGQTVLPKELIIVDDGQLDSECRGLMATLCATAAVRLVCLQKQVPGLPASRNLALRHACGDIIQFLDDDVVVDADFCRHILRLYQLDCDGTVVGIEGVLINPPSTAARAFEIIYRLAGWWKLRPKSVRRQPLPPILRDERWAIPTHLLAGACMSFRRSALLNEPFDERLNGYALGEDRDMSLRLSRRGRLLHSRGARALHHHDPNGRPDHFQFGRMTVLNYAHIMRSAGRTSVGDRFVIGYSFAVIASFLALCSILKPRRYAPELMGVLAGLAELIAGNRNSPDHVEML